MKHELRKYVYFEQLTDDQLDQVVRHAHRVTLSDGQILFRQGAPASRFYLLIKGHIKLLRISPDGHEKVIEVLDPGETFGEAIMFLEGSKYPVFAVALGNTKLISINAAGFLSILRESVDLCFLILGGMSSHYQRMVDNICDLYLTDAHCRVISYLSDNAPPDSNEYRLEIPKSVLASRLSITPETLSRITKKLKSDGLVEIAGRRVLIRNRRKLEKAAYQCCTNL